MRSLLKALVHIIEQQFDAILGTLFYNGGTDHNSNWWDAVRIPVFNKSFVKQGYSKEC